MNGGEMLDNKMWVRIRSRKDPVTLRALHLMFEYHGTTATRKDGTLVLNHMSRMVYEAIRHGYTQNRHVLSLCMLHDILEDTNCPEEKIGEISTYLLEDVKRLTWPKPTPGMKRNDRWKIALDKSLETQSASLVRALDFTDNLASLAEIEPQFVLKIYSAEAYEFLEAARDQIPHLVWRRLLSELRKAAAIVNRKKEQA